MNDTPTYTKGRLVKELAFTAGISQVKARQMLDALRTVICREAATGPFILPGICKFETAVRKARHIRNPRTGEALLLPEHRILRVTPSKTVREAVAPRVCAIKVPASEIPSPVPEQPVAPAAPEAPAPAPVAPPVIPAAPEAPAPAPAAPAVSAPPPPPPPPPPAAEPAAPSDDFILPDLVPDAPAAAPAAPAPAPEPEVPAFTVAPNGDITFRCQHCGQEIEAPGDMAGTDAECPSCGTMLHVPQPAAGAAVATAGASHEVVSAAAAEAIDPAALKNKTIRIDATELGFDEPAPAPQPASDEASGMISFFCPGCHQEIEATADMAGSASECPNCGTAFEVPFFSEKGTVHAEKEELFDPRKVDEQKHKTMRIDLDDF